MNNSNLKNITLIFVPEYEEIWVLKRFLGNRHPISNAILFDCSPCKTYKYLLFLLGEVPKVQIIQINYNINLQ